MPIRFNKFVSYIFAEYFQDLLNDFQDVSGTGDDLINFEEFCQGVASLLEAPQQQRQLQQQQHHKQLLQLHEEPRVQKQPKDEGKLF